MKKLLFKLMCISMLIVFFNKSSAQDTVVNLLDLSLDQLVNMEVVSSTKIAQKQALAPNVISLINKNSINGYNWRSINDVLHKQAGFFPSQDYERSTVGSRGIPEGWNNNHLLLLIDGIPFNTGLYGTAVTSEYTPLIFTKTLEIIKGPGSALYGSNATNGVITLNTISASDYNENKLFANIRYGEKNTMFYDILATFKTKFLDITSSISYNATDGEKYQSYDGSLELNTETNQLKKFEPNYKRYSGYFFIKLEGKESIKGLSLQFHSQLTNSKTGHGWLWHIPDKTEKIQDNYNSLIVKYQKDLSSSINAEIAVKYTNIALDWDMWYYRAHAYDDWYPNGGNEYLKTSFDNVFTRLQFIFKLPAKSVFVVATEPNFFLYSGDKKHYSNIDLLNSTDGYPPLTNNANLGPYLELIKDKPVNNIGSFVQFSTGELLGKYIQITTGLRYDNQFFSYSDVNEAGKPTKSKTFNEFSPRLSIVVIPTEKLTLKLLGVTAFRAPAPTELFGYNTWAIASNINQLKPERIKSVEFAIDYNISQYFNIRMNTYYTISEGQIGYSLGNYNLSTNIYDLTNAGFETELLFVKGNFSAFANLSYVQRVDEKIFESELDYVSLHKDKVTWAPSFTANLGCEQRIQSFKITLQGHYQGKVLRRDKDFYPATDIATYNLTQQPRPTEVKDWISFDAQLLYKFKSIEIGISGTNIFDSDNYLIKSMKFPFDYKMEGRRVSIVLNIEL